MLFTYLVEGQGEREIKGQLAEVTSLLQPWGF